MSIDAAGLSKMLREDRAEWDALVVLLDAHPHQVLYGGASVWASRDVYAHLARCDVRAAAARDPGGAARTLARHTEATSPSFWELRTVRRSSATTVLSL